MIPVASKSILRFHVDGMPQSKGSWRPVTNRRTGGIAFKAGNEAEGAWAEQVAWAARQALQRPPAPDRQRYQVALDFTLLPPAGRGGRKNRRDIDKLARSCLDALTGIVWADDEQVKRLLLEDGVTGEDERGLPGVEVAIAPWVPASWRRVTDLICF